MKYKKLLSLPLLAILGITGTVLALFVVSVLGVGFDVSESITVEYVDTEQETDCNTIDSSDYSVVPSSGVTLPDVQPGDNERICFKVTSTNDDHVTAKLVLSDDWTTSSVISNLNVIDPGSVDSSSEVYGYVDYDIAGDVDPENSFSGTIDIGRE